MCWFFLGLAWLVVSINSFHRALTTDCCLGPEGNNVQISLIFSSSFSFYGPTNVITDDGAMRSIVRWPIERTQYWHYLSLSLAPMSEIRFCTCHARTCKTKVYFIGADSSAISCCPHTNVTYYIRSNHKRKMKWWNVSFTCVWCGVISFVFIYVRAWTWTEHAYDRSISKYISIHCQRRPKYETLHCSLGLSVDCREEWRERERESFWKWKIAKYAFLANSCIAHRTHTRTHCQEPARI